MTTPADTVDSFPAVQVPESVTPGQEPVASPKVRWAGLLTGVVFVALAAVLGRELWALNTGATSWVRPVLDLAAKPVLESWMLFALAGVIVLGLLAIWAAVAPRKRTHLRLQSPAGMDMSMWTRRVDIARRASAVARRVPGVTAARSQASHSKLALTVNGDIDDPALAARVKEAVTHELSALAHGLDVQVTVQRLEEVDINV
ncbi:DUF6286 domain-containing protein [Corynebacterium lizhenjunii]|uniref:DUF6286 domain-containing protein n=1 Tax=Corynebacterium lizhenjunii TaxID=2709394 RepID=UPI0013EC1C9A|nr:DUF6286 domain-containing protein [Corynebacterium lizhenjunii]